MPKARKAQRICPHCKKVFSTSYLAEHRRSCTNQKSTCRVCYTEFSRKRDHKCKGTPVELPNYLADFIDVSQYNWGEQVPRSIPGLTPIHEASVATKSLWHRMPRLVHIKAPVPELKVFLAVNKSLKTLSYHAYKNGTAVHGSGLREHSAAQRKAMAETASISIFQAISRGETKSTKPTLYSDSEPLCYVVNVWTEDIALSPPEYINARYILCGDTTDVGINITPEGSLIDLHCDIGRAGLSVVYGQCEKVLLLFPPTKYNLEHFASTAGLPNRLARIGHLLEGGLVVRINRSLAIDLPSGALHAVFTTAGGFLGGINFSIVEELPIMARSILAQLPYYKHNADAILEDIKVYFHALQSALRLDPPHNILVPTIKSWVDLEPSLSSINSLPKWCQQEKERIVERLNCVRPLQYNCGTT